MTIVNATTWEAAIWQEPVKRFKKNNEHNIPYAKLNDKWFCRMAHVDVVIEYRKEIDAMYAYKQFCEYMTDKMNALDNVYVETIINVYKVGKLYNIEANITYDGTETSNDYEFEAHMTGGSIIDRLELNGSAEQFAITMTSGSMTEYWIGGVNIG